MLGVLLDAHGLLLALAGTGVGAGPLTAHRQAALVADPAVTIDGSEPLQLRLALAAEVAFHLDRLGLDHLGDLDELFLTELSGADVGVDARMFKDLGRRGATDAKHVGQRSFDALLIGNFNA